MSDFDTRRPFSRAAAIATGLDPRVLEGSGFRRIFRGVYVGADVALTPRMRVRAALVPFGSAAFVSHASAARWYGVPIPPTPLEHVSVLHPNERRRRADIRCHVTRDPKVVLADGVRVSAPEQMFVELADSLTLVDLVVAGDHLVRTGRTTVSRLRSFTESSSGRSTQLARRAASYVRERVDSPMETRLRMLMVLAGLPEPDVNPTVFDDFGHPIRRYDLRYRSSRTVIEYDGRHHIEREAQWEHDLDRREDTEHDGERVLVVVSKGVYVEPERTLCRIHRVLRERGEPGVPARLSDDWRPHFPSRERAA